MTEVTSRPITMAQVAQYAGVSQASVSRVLNGVATVDPAIVAKVNRAVAALNYSPSEAARSLVRGRSHTIALLVPDLENPMFQGVLKGLTVAAARDGYRVLVADSAEAVGVEAEIARRGAQQVRRAGARVAADAGSPSCASSSSARPRSWS